MNEEKEGRVCHVSQWARELEIATRGERFFRLPTWTSELTETTALDFGRHCKFRNDFQNPNPSFPSNRKDEETDASLRGPGRMKMMRTREDRMEVERWIGASGREGGLAKRLKRGHSKTLLFVVDVCIRWLTTDYEI